MGSGGGWRTSVVRAAAVALTAIAVISIGLIVKSVVAGDNEALTLLGIPPLIPLAVLPWSPLRHPDRFRDKAALVGWLLFLFGLLLTLVYVGVLLLPFAIAYLAVAYAPPRRAI